jgi:hypothetical protein
MGKRMASLEDKLEAFLSASQGQQQASTSASPENWSLDQLESYATRQDIIEESPHAANQAMLLAMKRMIKDATNDLRGELLNETQQTLTQRQEADAIRESITRDFGKKAWDQGSELFQEADVIYRQYQNKFGKPGKDGQIELDPYYLRTAFLEAQKLLDARASQDALKAETPMEDAMKTYQGPPPGAIVEGMSEGSADALAERRKAISDGNVEGAISSIAKQLYPT